MLARTEFDEKTLTLLTPTAVAGLHAAYGLGPEFGAALAVIAIALTGDPIHGTWSIGQGFSVGVPILDGLLTQPEGISFSHNSYESDASIVRVSPL